MKFLCSNCKAKYQISDDKVVGRTLRMTCRKCKEEIVIRGETNPVPVAAPRPFHPASRQPSALVSNWNARLQGATAVQGDNAALDEWHVAINDTPVGPMRREEVARKMAGGAVGPASLAWREGLDDWIPVAQIPELAVLLPGGGSVGLAVPAPPPMLASPAQRVEAVPLGGRAGAGAFSSEEWAPPPPDTSPSQVARNPVLDVPLPEPARTGLLSFGQLFAVLGFALLMTVIAIVGAKWLNTEKTPVVADRGAPQFDKPAREETEHELGEGEPEAKVQQIEEMVIDLDTEEPQPGRKARSTPSAKSEKDNGKQLTEEQRKMPARMGGTGAGISDIKTRDTGSGNRSTAGKGELTAAQLSAVVRRGKTNLQRCYETAARSSGKDDTVRMDVSVTISAAGNVKKVNASGPGLPGMDKCIERSVRMWRFPASGGDTETRFPIVFSPGG